MIWIVLRNLAIKNIVSLHNKCCGVAVCRSNRAIDILAPFAMLCIKIRPKLFS